MSHLVPWRVSSHCLDVCFLAFRWFRGEMCWSGDNLGIKKGKTSGKHDTFLHSGRGWNFKEKASFYFQLQWRYTSVNQRTAKQYSYRLKLCYSHFYGTVILAASSWQISSRASWSSSRASFVLESRDKTDSCKQKIIFIPGRDSASRAGMELIPLLCKSGR